VRQTQRISFQSWSFGCCKYLLIPNFSLRSQAKITINLIVCVLIKRKDSPACCEAVKERIGAGMPKAHNHHNLGADHA